MGNEKAQRFIQEYLNSARGYYAHEQSVLAMGERRGHNEKRVRAAADRMGILIDLDNETWTLPKSLRGPRPAGRIRSSRRFARTPRARDLV